MGKETILNSVAKIAAAPLEDYTFPSEADSFTGTLTHRKWHRNKPALLCYFDTDDGNKYMLMVWWNSRAVSYCPKHSRIDFANDVAEGSRWRCEYEVNKSRYISWLIAESISLD